MTANSGGGLLAIKGGVMKTIYECESGESIYYARNEREALDWLDANPTGKYRNTLHRFVINGGGKK